MSVTTAAAAPLWMKPPCAPPNASVRAPRSVARECALDGRQPAPEDAASAPSLLNAQRPPHLAAGGGQEGGVGGPHPPDHREPRTGLGQGVGVGEPPIEVTVGTGDLNTVTGGVPINGGCGGGATPRPKPGPAFGTTGGGISG